jgi:hypothetical protein
MTDFLLFYSKAWRMPGCSSPLSCWVRFTDWSRTLQNDDGRVYCGYQGNGETSRITGACATISHTSVVWLIAMGGMYVSQKFTAESAEPWFQLISAIIILATAAWMFWRTWRGEKLWKMEQEEEHGHGHHEHDETRIRYRPRQR